MQKMLALLPLLAASALAGGAGPAPAPALPPQFLEVWEGTYTCAQGVTGARLNIREWNGQTFKLLGEMYPVGSIPGVPRGRAELWGNLQGDLSSGQLNITGWRWLMQPQGYVLDKLSAHYELSSDYRHIKLTIDPPTTGSLTGCTGGEFHRVK